MKVSQLIHVMDRNDEIVINDFNEPIDKSLLYKGTIKDIKKKIILSIKCISLVFVPMMM